MSDDYRDINRANWDERAPAHAVSEGYAVRRLVSDPAALSGVVEFDRPLLGDIAGLRGVHLQCHIGTDTLSLHRLGARMSGLDFSPAALHEARALAAEAGAEIDYVESTVDGAVAAFGAGGFDLVYTGIGALCWLPRIRDWAQTVATLLRPGGRLFIREGHPMLWSLCDPRPDGLVTIEYPYFETAGTVFVEEQSYVEHDGVLESPTIVSFNHSLSEVFNALWSAGLTVTLFEEHQSVPWNPLAGEMVEFEPNEFRLREMPERLAATYTLRAVKN